MKPAKGTFEINGKKTTWETTFDQSFRFRCIGKATCCVGGNYELMKRDAERGGKIFDGKTDGLESSLRFKRTKIKSKENGECVFLGNDRCKIYEKRPAICRTFPFTIIFTSDDHAFIDLNWQCCALECLNDPSVGGETDLNEMVKEKYLTLSKEKLPDGKTLLENWLENYQKSMKISELLDKKMACEKVWDHIVDYLDKCRDIVDVCSLITSFMETRQDIPYLLKLSHCGEYIRMAGKKERNSIGEEEWGNFISNNFFNYMIYFDRERKGKPLLKKSLIDGKLYKEVVEDNMIKIQRGETIKEIEPAKIQRKDFDKEAKKFLIKYLKYIWRRKFVEFDFSRLMNLVYAKTGGVNLYSFAAQLLVSRYTLENLQFHLAIISEKNGHSTYTKEDVMETIDLIDTMVIMMCSSSKPVFEGMLKKEE